MKIDKESKRSAEADDLRRHAEELLTGAEHADARFERQKDETLRLIHELQVHQVELEMQNAELRRTRDEVEAAREKYADLYEFSPVGYFTLDREGIIHDVNLTGASLLGMERSRLTGRSFGLLVAFDTGPAFTAFLGKVFSSKTKEACEVDITTAGNSRLNVQIEAIADMSGTESRIAVIDITARRSAENALAKKRQKLEELNRSLEARIASAVDELRRKDELLILQDRLAVMGEMINNIAHQWRQPLNMLGLLIQQTQLFYDSDKFSREFLDETTAQGMELIQHMSRTVDDFRNFFKSDKEKVTFIVNQVISRTLSLVEKSFEDQKIGIALHFEGDPILCSYPNEYAQVLLNILMNARDALVERKTDDALIAIRAFSEGGNTIVTIADNAGGIDDENLDRIFEPYFTTKGPDKGTGIGLFMSRVIIEKNMGGRLTVRNTGSGAEFRIEV